MCSRRRRAEMMRSTWATHLGIALAVAIATSRAVADGETPSERAEKLARDFSDPLTTVPQLFLKDAYTPSNFGTEAPANRLTARLLIPRVPRLSILPDQLIRPTFQLVTVPNVPGRGTRTEFGDIQLFDLAVLPWSSRESGVYMGVGPMFVFPTATSSTAGQNAWQVGPAFGAVYKGLPGFLFGALIQNPISFAYTSSEARPLNTLLVQPIVFAYVGHGFYLKSGDSTWAMGWRHGSGTTLPLSFGVGYVLLHENWPVINFFVSGEWMAYRQYVTVAPQTSVDFGLSVAFPDLRPWD
jgi:hypothetical protein